MDLLRYKIFELEMPFSFGFWRQFLCVAKVILELRSANLCLLSAVIKCHPTQLKEIPSYSSTIRMANIHILYYCLFKICKYGS